MSTPYGPAAGAPHEPVAGAQHHPSPGTKTPVIASAGIRAGAFAIDAAGTLVVTVATSLGLAIAGFLAGYNSSSGYTGTGAALTDISGASTSLIPLAAGLLYAVLTSRRGSSIGHRMLGLQVVDIETRALVPLKRGVLRTLVLLGPMVLALVQRPLFWLIWLGAGPSHTWYVGYRVVVVACVIAGLLWWTLLLVQVLTGRLALHDRAAGTMVLAWKVRPAAPQV